MAEEKPTLEYARLKPKKRPRRSSWTGDAIALIIALAFGFVLLVVVFALAIIFGDPFSPNSAK